MLFIALSDKKVCGYTIYKKQSELPFRVDLLDHETGAVKVVLNDGSKLDYERRHKYKFEIASHDCATGKHADRWAFFMIYAIMKKRDTP